MSSLQQRKLKIWSSAPNGGVYVWQDGSAADADADVKIDNGFRSPGDNDLVVGLQTLRGTWSDVPEFTFSLARGRSWIYSGVGSYSKVQPGDKVEFWAEVPDVPDEVFGDLPDWHVLSETPSTQVRLFYGWVESVSPSSADGAISVTCHGALNQANEIRLWRDNAQGITVPAIAFNVRDYADGEFYYSIKEANQAGARQPGMPFTAADASIGMTVKSILEYLESEYGAALATEGITASSTIFEASDLTGLTMVPPPIILRDLGFSAGLRQILKFAPHVRLIHDPRALKFRIVPVAPSLTNNSTTMNGVSQTASGGRTQLFVVDESIFSATPGAEGNTIRIQSASNEDQWELATVESTLSGVVFTNETLSTTYTTADTVHVVSESSLPTVTTPVERSDANSIVPSVDRSDTYTAVRIVSHSTETTTHTGTWSPGGGIGGLEKGWDSSFESVWKRSDERREVDNGADGEGIPVYTEDTGGTGGRVRLYVAFEDTAFDTDHVNDEWNGCSCVLLTINNANARNSAKAFEIKDSTTTSDIGDGRAGLILEIDSTDIDTDAGATFIVGTDGGTADRIALSGVFREGLPTTSANGRWKVGRAWYFTSESVSINGPGRHTETCYAAQFVANDCVLDGRSQTAHSFTNGVPSTNASQGQQWETLSGGGKGATFVWRRSFTTPRATACPAINSGACGGTGWTAPKSVEATIERTSTTLREVRFPTSGFGGIAYLANGLEREKVIETDAWDHPAHDAFFESMAYNIWQVASTPHYSGTYTLWGVKEWGGLVDLGVRTILSHDLGPVGGAGDFLRSMWAIPIDVTLDFQADAVRIDLDNKGPYQALATAVAEDLGVNGKLRTYNAERLALEARQTAQCALDANRNPAVSGVCASDVYSQGRPLPPTIRINNKDNQANGLGPNDAVGPSSSRGGGTLGPRADATVIDDMAGDPWMVMPSGAIVAGSISSGTFTENGTGPLYPETTGTQLERLGRGALALFGLEPVLDERPIFSEVSSVATGASTVFTMRHKGLTASALVGGRIVPNTFDADNSHGEGYTITANTASTITVAALSGDDPPDGAPAIIWPPRAPRPDETDFPSGGLVVLDAAGNYAVIDYETDEITPGTLNGSTNRIEADSAGSTSALRFGAPPASGMFATMATAIPRAQKVTSITDGVSNLDAMTEMVFADTTSGSASVNLPYANAVEAGHTITIKDVGGNSNVDAISIAAQSGDDIDGESAVTITLPYESITLTSDGAGVWHEIGRLVGTGEATKDLAQHQRSAWNPVTNDCIHHWHNQTSTTYNSNRKLGMAVAADSTTSTIGTQVFDVPPWYAPYSGSYDVVIEILFFLQSAPSASDAVRFNVQFGAFSAADGSTTSTLSDTSTDITVDSYSADEPIRATLNTGSAWVSGEDYAQFVIRRYGANANDTFAGTIHVAQARVISGSTS